MYTSLPFSSTNLKVVEKLFTNEEKLCIAARKINERDGT